MSSFVRPDADQPSSRCLGSLRWVALFACLGLVSSCGLTLDYSPPDDGGFDAQLDARLAMIDAGDTGTDAASLCTSPCRMGSVCVEGRCVVPCSRPSDCRDDALCEVCADGFCAPAPLDLCGVVDGCFQTSCDPMADACGPGVDMCAPRSLACIGGTCMAQHCMDSAECSASHDPQGCPFVCDADVQLCAAPNHVCPPRRPGDCRAEDPCSCVLLSTADPSLCPSGAPICDPASLSCVGCVSRSDCSDAAAPACDPGSHRCVACAMDGDCGPTEQCELGSHTCVGCLRNTDCLSPGAGVCAPDTHRCVACVASRDCDATAGICDPASRTCVACLSGRDCLSPSASVCDPLMRRCRPCGADTECVGGMTCVAGMCRPRGCLDPGECPTVA